MKSKIRSSIKEAAIQLGYFSEPSFIIGGAQKSGTTILYSYLKMHPQIVEPGFKEPHFFDTKEKYEKGIIAYRKNFFLPYKFKYGQITFEATPDYLYYPSVPERIYNAYPNMQFIFVLRDPVARAFSAWNMHHYLFKEKKKYQHLYDPRSFEEAIESEIAGNFNETDIFSYLLRGIYYKQLERFYKTFGRHNILIIDSLNLKNNTQTTLNKVTSFLGLHSFAFEEKEDDPSFWNNKGDYKVSLDPFIKERLRTFFKPQDLKLEALTNQKFYWFGHV